MAAEQKVNPDLMALMFVRALILDTDPIENRIHNNRPCPVVIWEDCRPTLDDHVIGGSNAKKKQ